MKRILGLDFGEKRIGMAISDEQGKIARPYGIARQISEIKEISQKEKIKEIVIGLPKTLKGEEGKTVAKVKEFAQKIKKETGLPIIFLDERFSTKEAQRILEEKGIKGKRAKEKIDILSAVLILENYLRCLRKSNF